MPTDLIAGATRQNLRLVGDCATEADVGRQLTLTNGSKSVPATVVDVFENNITLQLTNVPTTIDGGEWTLGPKRVGTGSIGIVKLDVVKQPLSVAVDAESSPVLDVHLAVKVGEIDLDNRHSQRAVGGQAVVTPVKGEYDQFVENVARVRVASELAELARDLTARQAQQWVEPGGGAADPRKCAEKWRCDDLEQKVEDCPDSIDDESDEGERIEACRTHRRVWRVRSLTWDDDAALYEHIWWYPEKPVRFDVLGEISFAVFKSHQAPFDVEVSLVAIDAAGTETPVFAMPVRLANGARGESLPLPLARSLYVQCGHGRAAASGVFPSPVPSGPGLDVVTNGGTRAVNDEDLVTGACRIHYSVRMLLEALRLADTPESRDLLKYFGPQLVRITITHGDAPEQTRDAPIDPTVDSDIFLPTLTGGKKTNGIYTVSVKPLAPLPPAVIYRGHREGVDAGTAAASSELEFRANLRPRGPYGWQRAPLRMFATIPVNATGVRFPSAPADLGASSEPTGAQVIPLQVGVLFAVEPWNYDTGRNAWPVPTRFVTGMHLLDLSHGAFAPSWVTGVSVTLPILDLQKGVAEDQLGTDLAAGLFWEVDMRERQFFTYGHHLLLTLGVNVLTLFGSK